MKNKDFYKDRILKIALKHDTVGVIKNTGGVVACDDIPYCEKCLLFEEDDGRVVCDENFIKWLDQEVGQNSIFESDEQPEENKPKDSSDIPTYALDESGKEKGFLEVVERGYVARDEVNNALQYFEAVPEIRFSNSKIYYYSPYEFIGLKKDCFDFIKQGECWAYNTNAGEGDKNNIYNITKELKE